MVLKQRLAGRAGRPNGVFFVKQRPVSKDVPRAQIKEDVKQFLEKGGKIDYIESGVSGVKPKTKPNKKK